MEIDPETQVLTGKIAKVAYGDGKYHVTREWCERNGVDLADCTFYTDSMSDVMLMEHVGTPVAVNPDARLRAHAQKMGWDIQDWGIAEKMMMLNIGKKFVRAPGRSTIGTQGQIRCYISGSQHNICKNLMIKMPT